PHNVNGERIRVTTRRERERHASEFSRATSEDSQNVSHIARSAQAVRRESSSCLCEALECLSPTREGALQPRPSIEGSREHPYQDPDSAEGVARIDTLVPRPCVC